MHNTLFGSNHFIIVMLQKLTTPEKLNNLAARSLQNQFVTNLHEAYVLKLVSSAV